MSDDLDAIAPRPLLRPQSVQAWLHRGRGGAAATPRRAPAPPRAPRLPPARRRAARVWLHSGFAAAVLILAVWATSGFYKVQPDQQGLVLRFGRWVATSGPGLNYHLPAPIETVLLPRVTEINQLKISNGAVTQMLTGDENIVEATAAVFWRVRDPAKFLFSLQDPEGTVRIIGESAVRQVIGLNPIQAGLSDQRQKIADDATALLQRLLDSYDAGIQVTQVQLQRVDPPTAVIDAFNDVQRARADQERARNEAQSYQRDILPRARGEAERIRQEAQAYRAQTIDAARGEADRFLAIYGTYKQAPEIIARRMYLDTMEEVLKSASKILIDPTGHATSELVPYLPLTPPPPRPPATTATARAVP
jgi:membrane protease subunit HflK